MTLIKTLIGIVGLLALTACEMPGHDAMTAHDGDDAMMSEGETMMSDGDTMMSGG